MPTPLLSTAFGDVLDVRIERIFHDQYESLPDMVPQLFGMAGSNGRNDIRWSNVGALPDFSEFSGNISYSSASQGYDTILTPVEFAEGIQIERKLLDDDQFNVIDSRPRALAAAAFRTRQKHGARLFGNAFSVDSYFYNNTEGVSLCSNSHTTTSGASTASGFDNLVTTSMTAVAVASLRIQMVGFRGDQGEIIGVMPDELWYPPDLYEQAYEIIASSGKVDTALNNANVHTGKYKGYEWQYMANSSTKNWFMCDSSMRKQMLQWSDRIGLEFAYVEDFDTLLRKYRAYMRYGNAWIDWRFIGGAQVT